MKEGIKEANEEHGYTKRTLQLRLTNPMQLHELILEASAHLVAENVCNGNPVFLHWSVCQFQLC